jgi:hypothetical protein
MYMYEIDTEKRKKLMKREKRNAQPGVVVYIYYPSYLGGRGRRISSSRFNLGKGCKILSQNQNIKERQGFLFW